MASAGYGRLYVSGGATAQTLNAVANTFDKMTGFATDGVASKGTVSNTADTISLASAGGDQMPVHVAFSVAFTVGAAGMYRFAIYKDGVAVPGSERRISCALSTTYTVSGHTLDVASDGTSPVYDLRVAADVAGPTMTPSNASLEVWA